MNPPSFLQPRRSDGSGNDPPVQVIHSPIAMSGKVSSPRAQSDNCKVDAYPGTPSYQRLMKNLDIQSPISATPTMTPTPTRSPHYLTPKTLPHAAVNRQPLDVLQYDTPSSFANAHQTSPNVCPRSSTPLFDHHHASPFMHHQGSPFMAFGQNQASKIAAHHGMPQKHDVSIPSPRLMPLKLVDQKGRSSKPYDPFMPGSSMKSSPLVKSLDSSSGRAMSPLNLGLELNTPTKNYEHPPLPNIKMTPRSTPGRNGHPPLPNIKLTPRSTPRRTCENGQPPLPSIRLTPRSTPRKRNFDGDGSDLMMDIDQSPSRIGLATQALRKVSVDNSSPKFNAFTPDDMSMASTDPMISMVLSVESGKASAHQVVKHFPHTPKMTNKKSRSLFDPNGKDESIQSLLRADAMVDVARANADYLTDDEDEDPDYVLCSPPSFCSKRKSSKSLADDVSLENDGFKLKNSSFLPSFPSVTSLLGEKHLQDAPEQDCETKCVSQSESHEMDPFKAIRYNSSMCSLTLSVDSIPGDSRRDLFTPPPTAQESGFRALSPPPLLPNPIKPH
jgi:hypothetical protein